MYFCQIHVTFEAVLSPTFNLFIKHMKKNLSLKRWQILLLLAFWVPFNLMAQTIQVKGTVYDNAGIPIIGANILEKGTTNGMITDIDGNYTLTVSSKGTIVFSYVGYLTQEIKVNGKTTINVKLQEDTEMLDEVVVVGYGTMKKSDMTGAITSVDTEELTKRTTTSPAEALQGKVAGVNIMKTGGNAGAGVSVKIRGVKSFGDNEPLYIIDGFQGDINNVNPSDIESMEILKDGAAAAIYGSVAANGVVIITTKNGKKGDVKVDFNAYLSFTHIANQLEMVNADQYRQSIKTMFDNYNMYAPANKQEAIPAYVTTDNGIDTDWQDAMTRTGLSQNYMVSVRGGGEVAQYSISYNHADDKGIMLGNDYIQDNARMKLHMKKGIFDFDANLGLRYTNNKQPNWSLKEMYAISPLVPIYDENEKYGFGLTKDGLPSNNNVMADHYYQDSYTRNYHTTGNISVGIQLAPWLTFKSGYSYRGVHQRYRKHAQDYISNPQSPNKYPTQNERTYLWQEQMFDNVFNFNKDWKKNSLTVMLGSSIQATDYEWNSVGVEGKTTLYSVDKNGNLVTTERPAGFLDPSFDTIMAGQGGTFQGNSSRDEYRRASFFGRVNYNFANRYLVQATLRFDGSSKFGKNNRWGCFPSIAVGWRISEEEFFPKDGVMNNLKFRASWGRLGNEGALDYYDFEDLISISNKMYYGGYVQGNGSNPWPGAISKDMKRDDLKWETTDNKNIGFDLGFFNNRLTAALNYYVNETDGLLITKELAPSVGYDNPILNVGKIRNQGFEMELNWDHSVRDFHYNVGFNLSTISNKVVKLAGEGQALPSYGLQYGTDHVAAYAKQGQPISGFYLYRTDGIFQNMDEVNQHNHEGELIQPDAKPGDLRFKDLNNDGVINEDDKEYCGTGIPKLEMNLNFAADYKGFDMSFILSGAFGHKLYNGNKFFYESMKVPTKMLTSVLDAWTPENTNTTVPRSVYNDPNGNSRESDRFLENGSFVRLRQIQLGYTFPKRWMNKIKVEHLRLYVSGENLFTITGYDGVDPEFSRDPLNAGIDNDIYPFTHSYTVGAQITF